MQLHYAADSYYIAWKKWHWHIKFTLLAKISEVDCCSILLT